MSNRNDYTNRLISNSEPDSNNKIVIETNSAIEIVSEAQEEIRQLKETMGKLVDNHDKNTCYHEEVHRGGTMWTICDHCGKKWADDEGGFQPYEEPEEIATARKLIHST